MSVRITFGLQLDNYHPYPDSVTGGHYYLGPRGLLFLLESYLGLAGTPSDLEYLRIENYRQALQAHQQAATDPPFYVRSFAADQFATASELLSRRDELLMAGWDGTAGGDTPTRLTVLAAIEKYYDDCYPGYADRFDLVLRALSTRKHPIHSIQLTEPETLLPYPFRRLLDQLADTGVDIIPWREVIPPTEADTDLDAFRRALFGQPRESDALRGDGSLLLLRGESAGELAGYLAQLLRDNPDFQPLLVIPERSRMLDDAFVQEGLPGMGLESASLARPVLQILKLAPAFLWDPIDPYKMLEFVNLALKPLDDDLANGIAGELAASPGIDSENWRRTVARTFEQIAARYPDDSKRLASAREQYQFWFRRKRYPQDGTIPVREVAELFGYLQSWAYEQYDPDADGNSSLLVLSEQAKRIREILEALPEESLSQLEVERIVRTIYEPAPIVFQAEQTGRPEHIHAPGACIEACDDVIWWNFVQSDPVHFFSRWYQAERKWLANRGVELESPDSENQRRLWLRKRPVRQAKKRLVLIVPEAILGEPALPHPLLGDLEAAFGDLSPITRQCRDLSATPPTRWRLPARQNLRIHPPETADPFVHIHRPDWINERKNESFTSLESLLYYPYQWVFRYQLRLRKSSILSVVADETLMGKLAHRLFELLFQDSVSDWTQARLEAWIEEQFPDLLAREGAVLLLYGREPERISFLNRLKFAAWSLVSALQSNGWQIVGSEQELTGRFSEIDMRGVADLVLQRGDEQAILDLKWRGLRRRTEMIRNEEDLQLILYSLLHTGDPARAHTAYFIIQEGRLIARDNAAFAEVDPVQPDADRQEVNRSILERMQKTYAWRMKQLRKGELEIRHAGSADILEETYADAGLPWQELLEMRTEDAWYDDYRTLVGLYG